MDWSKLEEGVAGASEQPRDKREKWLAEFCAGDDALRREIESLLAFDNSTADFLELNISEYAARVLPPEQDELIGKEVDGKYKVLRRIGHGGMGTVYLAVRSDDQFKKRVALKVLRRGMDTEDVLRRFRQERQILAALEHPYIARLLDGGMAEQGLPYFVMEYVEGEPLDRYCDEKGLSTDERLRLFLKVASAVSYAHRNLVVHRDLKPSNIIISSSAEPKLLDFGIAKFLNPELSSQTISPTATFVRLMTPEYASPEQIRGRNITTRSDVYSLGVVLYKLLTGQNPHRFKSSSPQEIERVVCEAEPSRPSDIARTTASARTNGSNPRTTAALSGLRGDLDNIVLMALRKEPERRYASVADLAEDIQRYLEGRPVTARPNTFRYRASKFLRRHRIAVGAAALLLVAVLGGLAASLWQASIARRERDLAQAERLKAERISQFLAAAFEYSDPSAAVAGTRNRRDATIDDMLDDLAPRIDAELADQPEMRAYLQRVVASAYAAQVRLDDATLFITKALETHRRLFGEEHQETAHSLVVLGAIQSTRGDYSAGEATLTLATGIYERNPPRSRAEWEAYVDGLNGLGYTYWTRGSYAAAENAHSKALAGANEHGLSAKHSAGSKLGLGVAKYAFGKLDEAEPLLRAASGEYRSVPNGRALLPDALNNLGQILFWKGDYDGSMAALKESEQLSKEIWGESAPALARSLYLQTYTLCFKGDCRAAQTTLDRSSELYDRLLPNNAVAKANNLDAQNIIFIRTGRSAQGEALGRRAVELYESAMNPGAASITLARIHLAEALIAQGKLAEAEGVLIKAHTDAASANGTDHWRTRHAATVLSDVYRRLGDAQQAEHYSRLAR